MTFILSKHKKLIISASKHATTVLSLFLNYMYLYNFFFDFGLLTFIFQVCQTSSVNFDGVYNFDGVKFDGVNFDGVNFDHLLLIGKQ